MSIANTHLVYGSYRELFADERWRALGAAGSHPQRPLWASTGTKDPAYSDVLYVEDLIAPDTVNTLPEATLAAALDHLEVRPTIVSNLDDARRTLEAARAAGVDLEAVTAELLVEGLASF